MECVCLIQSWREMCLFLYLILLESIAEWETYFNNPAGQHLGGMANAMMFGGIAGWPFFPYVCDRWGRKVSITFGCCCIVLGVAIASQNHGAVVLVRNGIHLWVWKGGCWV